MAFICLWRHGAHECLLALKSDRLTIYLIDGSQLLQTVPVRTIDMALHLAKVLEADLGRTEQAAMAMA